MRNVAVATVDPFLQKSGILITSFSFLRLHLCMCRGKFVNFRGELGWENLVLPQICIAIYSVCKHITYDNLKAVIRQIGSQSWL